MFVNINNMSYATANTTWTPSASLHYGPWTPYGSSCKGKTIENYCGSGNSTSRASWTKWGNVTPRTLWNKVNTCSKENYSDNYSSPNNYLTRSQTWLPQGRYKL